MIVLITFTLPHYDVLLDNVDRSSRAHAILRNGCIERQQNGDEHVERTMKILCDVEEARLLLGLAKQLCPDAAAPIARAITFARE